MTNPFIYKKLLLTPEQNIGYLMLNFFYCEAVGSNLPLLSWNKTMDLLNRLNFSKLLLLMQQTSGSIYEYAVRNSLKNNKRARAIFTVERKHPFLARKFTVENKKINGNVFLHVLFDFLNEQKHNSFVRKEFKEIILECTEAKLNAA